MNTKQIVLNQNKTNQINSEKKTFAITSQVQLLNGWIPYLCVEVYGKQI